MSKEDVKAMIHRELKNQTPEQIRGFKRNFHTVKITMALLGISGMMFASYLFYGMYLMSAVSMVILVLFLSLIHTVCTHAIEAIDEIQRSDLKLRE